GEQDDPTAYNVTNLPTAQLSQGVLNDIYMNLYREGADVPAGLGEADGEPVFTLLISAEASKAVKQSDPVMVTDNRYAFMGSKDDPNSPLLVNIPTKRKNYGGYIHEIDPYPRRFTFSGGAYVEVAPFVKSATTKGNKWELNPAYQAAPYEEAIV